MTLTPDQLAVLADRLRETGLDEATIALTSAVVGGADLWLVMGQAGEYSDRQEWPVALYSTEAAAQKHVADAQTEEARLEREWNAKRPDERWPANYLELEEYDPAEKINRFDPNAPRDYTVYTRADWYAMKVGPLRGDS